MLWTAVGGAATGLLGGVIQDLTKGWIDRSEKKHQNELDIKRTKELAEHAFELDKKRAEANLDIANVDLQKTQLESNMRANDVTIAEQSTEQKYFDNISRATLEPLDYQVPFLQMQPYTGNKWIDIPTMVINFIYGLVNACIGLGGMVKYLREMIALARPSMSFALMSMFYALALKLSGEENIKIILESLLYLLDTMMFFWFYGRGREKFQKKN
jgi:hypothetical protein